MQTETNPEIENPGALAGATGAKVENFWEWFDSNAKRQHAATRLVDAVMGCHPEDRVSFLETILANFRPGFPRVLLIDAMRECREYASDLLPAYRKAMCLACFEALPAEDQTAFLHHVQGRAAA